jgi:hypothetical protein
MSQIMTYSLVMQSWSGFDECPSLYHIGRHYQKWILKRKNGRVREKRMEGKTGGWVVFGVGG